MTRLIPEVNFIEEKYSLCRNTAVSYKENPAFGAEEYRLSVESDGITIEASTGNGRFYAEKTLEQLKLLHYGSLPCVEVRDKPVFSYRGFMIDCARHFFTVDELKKIIDTASLFKFNRFHWHLSDDQGFRIKLESYPELCKKGAVRNGDSFRSLKDNTKPYGGFYTKDDIKQIVDFCNERFIEVIPEIDIPGHTSAILHTYPNLHCKSIPVAIKTKEGIFKDILCAGKEDTYTFIEKLFDEITEMFPGKYFHIGGDEAPKKHWKECPDCRQKMKELNIANEEDFQVWFGNRIASYLAKKGKSVIVWNDILKGKGLNKEIAVQKWMDIKNLTAGETNSGRKTILSDFKPLYCDYPYGMYTLRNIFDYTPYKHGNFSENGKANIMGIESPVWTEFVDSDKRLEYLIFPRWFAVAEKAWHGFENSDYADFKNSCMIFTEYLKSRNINCAPVTEWDMPIGKRLAQTVEFFLPR